MGTDCEVMNIFLCLLLIRFDAVTSVIYIQTGKPLTLNPKVKGNPEKILWTFNGNKAAEHDLTSFNEYGQFTGRSHIDITTGQITVRSMTRRDSGLYKSVIQTSGKMSYSESNISVIDAVRKPDVSCEPNEDSESNTLFCSVSSQSQVRYEWTGPNSARHSGQTFEISVKESPGSVYTCTVSNEVSQKSSRFTLENCTPERNSEVQSDQSIFLPAILTVTGIIFGIGVAVKCFKKLRGSKVQTDTRRGGDMPARSRPNRMRMRKLSRTEEWDRSDDERPADWNQDDDRNYDNDNNSDAQENLIYDAEETREEDRNENDYDYSQDAEMNYETDFQSYGDDGQDCGGGDDCGD